MKTIFNLRKDLHYKCNQWFIFAILAIPILNTLQGCSLKDPSLEKDQSEDRGSQNRHNYHKEVATKIRNARTKSPYYDINGRLKKDIINRLQENLKREQDILEELQSIGVSGSRKVIYPPWLKKERREEYAALFDKIFHVRIGKKFSGDNEKLLALLGELNELHRITFSYSAQKEFSELDIEKLEKLQKLNAVTFSGKNTESFWTKKQLAKIQWLEIVTFTSAADNIDKVLENIGSLSELKELNLNFTQIPGGCLRNLDHSYSLEVLRLEATKVQNDDLQYLQNLSGLKELDLSYTQITNEGLAHLKNIHQLEKLSLEGIKIQDEALKHFKNLPKLTTLDLSWTKITGSGLRHLQKIPELRELNLASTQIKDADLYHIKAFSQLKRLDLRNTKISQASVKALKESLPNLIVDF